MNKVIVKVKGKQTDAVGEESSVEIVAEGRHYFRGGKHYVLYKELMADGDAPTETMLKITPNSLQLLRKGSIYHEQYFALGEKSCSTYKTPYGNIQLDVTTDRIDIAYGNVSGKIEIDYVVAMNGVWQSRNELDIEVSIADDEISRLN